MPWWAGLLEDTRAFDTTDLALKWVEESLLKRCNKLIEYAIKSNSTLEAIYYRSRVASIFSIATSSPDRISVARLLPYAERKVLGPNVSIFDRKNAQEASLFLLFEGEVELTEQCGREVGSKTIFPGASAFYVARCVLCPRSMLPAFYVVRRLSCPPVRRSGRTV